MLNYGELHPITVHFPVVLITVALTLDVASQLTRNKMIFSIASWFVIATAISLIPTIFTGFQASYRFGGLNTYVNLHMVLGVMAFFGVLINGIIRLFYFFDYPIFNQFYTIILNGFSFLLLILTGDLGGVITHGKPFFSIGYSESAINYFTLNSSQSRSAKPEALEKILAKEINVRDTAAIFKKERCAECHNRFFKADLPNFSKDQGDQRAWLPRDSNNKLVKWEESPFYITVLQRNRMPYDDHNSPIGLPWGDRLILLQWLKNGAPEETPPIETQDEESSGLE